MSSRKAMIFQIVEFMLDRRNNSKGLFIAENGENDVADLVHDSPQSNHLGLRLTLGKGIIPKSLFKIYAKYAQKCIIV